MRTNLLTFYESGLVSGCRLRPIRVPAPAETGGDERPCEDFSYGRLS